MNKEFNFVSWNVNGLRACVTKGFLEHFHRYDADFFCLQEIKLQEGQIELDLGSEYKQYWNYAQKKGYSGTAIFTKHEPLSVHYGIEQNEEPEGRIITLEYESFYLITVYTPNAKRDLSRLPYRLEWEERFAEYVTELNSNKPVIICGDLNVAHLDIDVKNAKSNIGNSGFTFEERGCMTSLQQRGFVDSFRHLYPEVEDRFTWWSFMAKVRERNIGWRIDYFLVSEQLKSGIVEATIEDHVMGSDHCPVTLKLQLDEQA
ncbi:exodeoxyribonuclease III [Paenibacillus camelliae]|uniref:exodeoxyribonuclease III n=1 Tax=Paenibacillus camelliae TaxID=512410 RepID=UPI00203CABA2|nr:exodeoxyribonuclease III [Paenibacillus camelliae]MCM3633784.1 exodeoxyribonuclease III [Paenibacillus camelliae]